jgi:hypothetical protein
MVRCATLEGSCGTVRTDRGHLLRASDDASSTLRSTSSFAVLRDTANAVVQTLE